MADLLLTAVEARVIASLSEKSITTPNYYPMTVNALTLASNQKSSRDPVMQLKEGEVGSVLLDLAEKSLAQRDDAGSRVPKWRQNFQHHLLLQPATFAVLLTLMLRGPQTQAELRSNAVALGGPATAEGVVAALQDLADRSQPLVVLLPRSPGQKEARHAHTLSGPPELTAAPGPPAHAETPAPAGRAAIEERLRALEERVAQLEAKNAP
ncbi:MAG: YceH family protein [Nevskiaceae bacterium]